MARSCTPSNPCSSRRALWWPSWQNSGSGTPSAPSVQALNIVLNNTVPTALGISWTNGNGANRIVVIYPSAVYTAPTDGVSYTANSVYGSGSALEDGYVVYSGTGNSVNVTGITPGTTYYVKVFEANGTSYLTTASTNNPVSVVSSAYTLYPSTDRAVKAGVGPAALKGYYSFGGNLQFANGKEFGIWRLGSDHNSSADGDILNWTISTLGVVSSNVTVKADIASYNLSNASPGIGNSNRAFAFWLRLRAATSGEINGPGDMYLKYSDDLYSVTDPATATWSSEIRMTTDYGELNSTSSTSVNLNTVTLGVPFNVTIGTGLVAVNGKILQLASRSDFSKKVYGPASGYNSGTGQVTITPQVKAGTTTHTDWDASMNSYIDGPGEMIRLSNGDLLKISWITTGGGSSVVVYKSTAASNGLVWSYLSTVNSVSNADESALIQLLDGRLLCIMRVNPDGPYLQSFSSDNGATWGASTSTGITGAGKISIAQSPQGKVCWIARGTNLKTMLVQSTDNTFTSWSSQTIDNRGEFMYGSVFWNTIDLNFTATYAVEAINSAVKAGPTLIIRKSVVQSTTIVLPPTVYDVELQSVFDFATAAGETLPTDSRKGHLNTWYTAMRSGSIDFLSKVDILYPELNDISLEALTNRNWKKPWDNNKRTVYNSPTFAALGYQLNGTTQALLTPLSDRLNQLANYTQNDCAITNYSPTATQNDGRSYGTGSVQFIIRLSSDGLLYFRINDATYTTVANAVNSGFFMIQRTAGGNKAAFIEGASVVTGNVASAARPDQIGIGALHVSGTTFQNFSNKLTGMYALHASFVGKEMEWRNINRAYLTAIGAP